MGVATSLILLNPTNIGDCLIAVTGGALGGVAADIDTVDNSYEDDAAVGQVIAVLLTIACVLLDYKNQIGIIEDFMFGSKIITILGVIAYILLMIKGFNSNHRSFTHSFLALILFTISTWLIYPPLSIAYFAGYLSHLTLDVLNKKRVPLFYPIGKGICLKLFYAGKLANKVFMWIGIILSAVFIINIVGI